MSSSPAPDFLARTIWLPDAVVVIEVLNTESDKCDRIEKPHEYGLVPSIHRTVVVESATSGLPVLHRGQGADPWTALALVAEDALDLPEVAISLPVADIYEDVAFGHSATMSSAR